MPAKEKMRRDGIKGIIDSILWGETETKRQLFETFKREGVPPPK